MAINVLGSGNTTSATATASMSYTCHTGSNRRLIAWASQEGSGTQSVSAFTYNSVSLSPLIENEQGDMLTSIYSLQESSFPSSAGSYTLSVTSTYTGRLVLGVIEIDNVVQSPLTYDTKPSWVSSGILRSISLSTPASNNAIVIACGAGDSSSSTLTINTYVDLYESLDSGASTHCAGYSIDEFGGSEGVNIIASPAMELSLAVVVIEEITAPASRSFFVGGAGF